MNIFICLMIDIKILILSEYELFLFSWILRYATIIPLFISSGFMKFQFEKFYFLCNSIKKEFNKIRFSGFVD